jgi:hypothetical protein
MPAPVKQMMAEIAKANFLSKGIQVPVKWEGGGEQYDDAFSPSERQAAPTSPINLFREPSLNQYHVDAAGTIGRRMASYIDGISGAICDAIDRWMKMVTVCGLLINGPVGIILPGGMIGPPLFIIGSAPRASAQEVLYSSVIASVISQSWDLWQVGLTGILSYPSFAAFPGPMAPPTPNVPVPLMTLVSPGEVALSPSLLANTMTGMLGDPSAQHAAALFDALSKAFGTCFQTFKASTMIQNVLGYGAVPTFAPPILPAGPVVAGVAMPIPGVLL